MANGELANQVGMDTVPGSADIRDGHDEDNKTRDYIAQHRLSGTHPASAITSGRLPVARGGTGRSSLYAAVGSTGPHPTTRRILVVDNEDQVFASIGDIAPQYLGFRLHVENLTGLDFPDGGDLSVPHGAGFMPVAIFCQIRLEADSLPVEVYPRAEQPSWSDENVLLRAKMTSTGDPYPGVVSRLDLFVFGVA